MFDFLVFPKSSLILHQVITLVKGQFFRCFGKIFMFAGGRGPPAHGLPIRFSSFSEHSGAENKACCRACKKQKIACCIRSIACPWHFLRIPWFFRFVWLFRLFGSPRFFRLIRLFTDGDGLLSFFVCHRKIKAMREAADTFNSLPFGRVIVLSFPASTDTVISARSSSHRISVSPSVRSSVSA